MKKIILEKEYWVCDRCHKQIVNKEDGVVAWESSNLNDAKNLCLLHRKCNVETEYLSDRNLKSFLGEDGLVNLLEFISDDIFIDKEEVLEMIKRLHVTGYEQARLYFDEALSEQVIDINGKERYYNKTTINTILEHYLGK